MAKKLTDREKIDKFLKWLKEEKDESKACNDDNYLPEYEVDYQCVTKIYNKAKRLFRNENKES